MKIYGSISRLVSILFRKDSQDITVRPNQSTTYTASRDIQLPPGDAAHVLVSANSTQTFTNKTFDADGTGNSITNIENADIKAGAAIDATKIHDGSVTNTEFGYIGGLTSDAQTQLDARVVGPASATDEAVARFDGTTGKLVQNSSVTISDAGVVSGATQLNVDNLRLDGNALISTDSNGDVQLDPNGTGSVVVRDNATLKLADADNSAFIGHKSAATVSSSITYQWPEAPASNGYVLASQTDGTMSWVSNASSSSASDTWTAGEGTLVSGLYEFSFTHNLASEDVIVQVYDLADKKNIEVHDIERTSANAIKLYASEDANATGWKIMVLKI